MAEAPRNLLPSGYDEDFVNAVEDENVCLICHLPLKEPVQTRCGHRFCKECLEEHFRRQGVQDQHLTCPAERRGLDRDRDVFPDTATERKILSFTIKCPSKGCGWTGELRSKEVHLESCLFKLVPCTNENCHVAVQRKHLEEHETITCPWRILECDHCNDPQPECKMQDHIGQCSKFPVTCSNSCGASIPREMILNHIEDSCPLTIMPCPYERMGCETKVQRREVESHLQSTVRLHLDLACVKLNNTEVQLNDTEVKLNDTQAKLNSTEVKLNDTQIVLYDTEVKLNEKLDDMQETTRKLMEKLGKLEQKILEGTGSATENDKIMMVKHEPSDFALVFVWKINNFSEIWRRAKTGETQRIDSVPFYTESYGYKLKVKIYPDGISGPCKNTHLSMFIVVMKGKYDAILHWPFKKKVMFTLIDQQEESVERENVIKQFDSNNLQGCYTRPVNEENRGRGVADFISHEKLHSRRYLVDDTLFLQVEIGQ